MSCAECQSNCPISNKIADAWGAINIERKEALKKFPENVEAINANAVRQVAAIDELLEGIDPPEGCLLLGDN